MPTLSDFAALTIAGEERLLSDYAGQVVLVVNTASRCGFTPQYAGLQELYDRHRDEGFVVLGFPCNQFGSQEPGTEQDIARFCSLDYGVTFPMFAKIDVNGAGAHPLYQWLTSQEGDGLGGAITWNFTKFLLGRDGAVLARYTPDTEPSAVEVDVVAAVATT